MFQIPDDLVPVVYRSVVEYGSDEEWNFLWKKYRTTNSDGEKKTILHALGTAKRADVIQKYLDLMLSNEVKLKDKKDALLSTVTQKQNLPLVLDFVIRKHTAIDAIFETKDVVPDILSKIANLSTTNDLVIRIEKFVEENGYDAEKNLKKAMENAKSNLQWANKNVPTIINVIKNVH